MKLKITVEHQISSDSKECIYDGDLFGKVVCRYHMKRDHPRARSVPMCTLFNCPLEEEHQKCPQCIKASENGILVE